MRKIRVKNVDNFPNSPLNVGWIDFLKKYYHVEVSDNPEYVFCTPWGAEFMNYPDAIRILITGENTRPDFNFFDYAIGFDRLTFGDRYLRHRIDASKPPLDYNINYTERKFCNFVYFNDSYTNYALLRQDFCKKLTQYKRVDCPGRVLNNMPPGSICGRQGDWVKGKLEFIKNYKFTIAFENDCYPGYTTEKLIHPFLVNSVPIYFGDPDVTIDFNPKAFINGNEFKSFDELVEYVAYVDKNDDVYLSMLSEPAMRSNYTPPTITEGDFILNIIENGKKYINSSHKFIPSQPYHNIKYFVDNCWDKILMPLASKFNISLKNNSDSIINQYISTTHNDTNRVMHEFERSIDLGNTCNSFNKQFVDKCPDSFKHQYSMLETLKQWALKGQKDNRIIQWPQNRDFEERIRRQFVYLWPHHLEQISKRRIGESGDGGCIMLEPSQSGIALSFGHKGNGEWELSLAKMGWQVWQFDTHIKTPVQQHINLHFINKAVSANISDGSHILLSEVFDLVGDEKNLLLRMDMEGDEWNLLEVTTSEQIERFTQFYVEFHGLTNPKLFESFEYLIQKIRLTHIPVHIHAHNCGPLFAFDKFIFPHLLEVTFANKNLGVFTPSQDTYPTPLDAPNIATLPDIYLGKFQEITGIISPENYEFPLERNMNTHSTKSEN